MNKRTLRTKTSSESNGEQQEPNDELTDEKLIKKKGKKHKKHEILETNNIKKVKPLRSKSKNLKNQESADNTGI